MERMKTNFLSWTVSVVVVSCTLVACQKEKSETGDPKCSISMTGLAGTYKLTALQYRQNASAAPVDYLAYMDACEQDNLLILKSDGTYEYRDLGTICPDAEPNTGTWEVNGHQLTSDGTLNGTLASYDCKTMVYYLENAIRPGDQLTYTLVKQ